MKDTEYISLKEMDERGFAEIRKEARYFQCEFCMSSIIKDSIFVFIRNYIRKAERKAEIMFFPFLNDDLEAVSFIRDDTIFLCLNTERKLSDEIYASANELYRIFKYIEDEDCGSLCSILTRDMIENDIPDATDAEANAFARLLLIPDNLLSEAVSVNGIDFTKAGIRDVLLMMSLFAVPFRPAVIRLYECGYITKEKALTLLSTPKKEIENELKLSAFSRIWQLSGKGTESLGSFMETYEYAVSNDFLPEGKKKQESDFIDEVRKNFSV